MQVLTREEIAKIIYDELEGPVNNQDARRQWEQWELSLRVADKIKESYDAKIP